MECLRPVLRKALRKVTPAIKGDQEACRQVQMVKLARQLTSRSSRKPSFNDLKVISRAFGENCGGDEVLEVLIHRLQSSRKRSDWKKVYNALCILEYIVVHTEESLRQKLLQDHHELINSLQEYKCSGNDSRTDHGYSVRVKAASVCNLLEDDDLVFSERQKCPGGAQKAMETIVEQFEGHESDEDISMGQFETSGLDEGSQHFGSDICHLRSVSLPEVLHGDDQTTCSDRQEDNLANLVRKACTLGQTRRHAVHANHQQYLEDSARHPGEETTTPVGLLQQDSDFSVAQDGIKHDQYTPKREPTVAMPWT